MSKWRYGQNLDPRYATWKGIKQRCYNKRNPGYRHYGGRGVRMCERWLHSFRNFTDDMGPKPEGATIERVNNNGHYEPGNCRWIPLKDQPRNRNYCVQVTIGGITKIAADWAREYGVDADLVRRRIRKGIDPILALSRGVVRVPKDAIPRNQRQQKLVRVTGMTQQMPLWRSPHSTPTP